MQKKAQAAMEFLMTYGWAILVVLAAIGALAYFGVLSPDKILPERCTGPAGLDCLEKASVVSTGTGANADNITFALKNNLGYAINVTSVNSAGDTDAEDCVTGAAKGSVNVTNSSGDFVTPDTIIIPNGQTFNVKVMCALDLSSGRIGQDFNIIYMSANNLEQRGLISIRGKS